MKLENFSIFRMLEQMINYLEGEYHEVDDPATKHLHKTVDKMNSPKQQGGCGVAVTLLGIGHFVG